MTEKERKSNKAQHEIVGFVLIIVVVAVIGLIFLGLSIGRGERSKQESVEISSLLEASMYYTSPCAVSFVPQYKDGQDLIKSCWKNEKCLDGEMACDVLEQTFTSLIGDSLGVCVDCVNKAYKFNIYYKQLDSESSDDEILAFEQGSFENCTSTAGGSHSIYVSSIEGGAINIELEVCRG